MCASQTDKYDYKKILRYHLDQIKHKMNFIFYLQNLKLL